MIFPSRSQLIRDLSLTRTDQMEISKRRGCPHRLGFAYQLGFVRAFQRFPVQQPLEICEELLSLVALQTGIDGGLLGDYASWPQTVSRHQVRIREYLGLRSFDPGQERGLEQFLYEESCRLEQTAALLARAREYLKREGTLFPAESVLRRIIGEQRRKARDAIAARVAEELPLEVGETLDKLLEVAAGETVSGLQGIKKNPAKPSAVAMRRLAERLTLIEATGVLGMDLEWLNRNYQRSLSKKMLDEACITEQRAALAEAAGQAFYNISKFTLRDLKSRGSRQQLLADFEDYVNGFSPNVQDILANFKFRNQLDTLSKADALGTLINKFLDSDIDLSPTGIDNHSMGTVYFRGRSSPSMRLCSYAFCAGKWRGQRLYLYPVSPSRSRVASRSRPLGDASSSASRSSETSGQPTRGRRR